MSENERRVVVFEDLDSQRVSLEKALNKIGWIVVAYATSMKDAFELVPQLESLGVEYAFVDGSLQEKDGGASGRMIAQLIQTRAPSVKTIGFSSITQDYVDIKFDKVTFLRSELTTLAHVLTSQDHT